MLRGNGGKLKESSQSFQLSSYSVTFLERNIWSRALALVKFISQKNAKLLFTQGFLGEHRRSYE